MYHHHRIGKWGEDRAARYLAQQGHCIIARNWRCQEGELDIVSEKNNALYIIEVKTRSNRAYGLPAEAVTRHKAAKLRRAAVRFLQSQPRPYRHIYFKVISIQK